MIDISKISNSRPYNTFRDLYNFAKDQNQANIEACCISSLDAKTNEIDSRFVNIKYIFQKEFIFFSNYESIKAKHFESHDQISAVFFWNSIRAQIRLKAKVYKSSEDFSDSHFKLRPIEKNALAISSNQSKEISSFDEVKYKFENTLSNSQLLNQRPKFWGGYSFKPYYFEFWTGHKNRLNKREVFFKNHNKWSKKILEP